MSERYCKKFNINVKSGLDDWNVKAKKYNTSVKIAKNNPESDTPEEKESRKTELIKLKKEGKAVRSSLPPFVPKLPVKSEPIKPVLPINKVWDKEVVHVFRAELNGKVEELLDGCYTLNSYINNLEILQKEATTDFFAEHGFQALIEEIINYKNLLSDYQVLATRNSDLQIQGKGLYDGKLCTVGIFYMSLEKGDKPLTSNGNHLTTFFANSVEKYYGVKQMCLFSNAIGLHENTKSQFIDNIVGEKTFEWTVPKENIHLFMRSDIELLIDNNIDFWDLFRIGLKLKIGEQLESKSLRPHQIEAINKCAANNIGKIIIPTGAGKSLIEAELIVKAIEKNPIAVCVIATPRIVLTGQLLKDTIEHLHSKRIDAQYLNLNSGSFDEDEFIEAMTKIGMFPRNIPSTVSPIVVAENYKKSSDSNVPLIICATYQSAYKLSTPIMIGEGESAYPMPIDLLISDEAHNLVVGRGISKESRIEFHRIPVERKYFFTATEARRESEDGIGMNNEDAFGEIIYTRSPKDMIMQGEIIPPYIHEVKIDEYKICNAVVKIPEDIDDIEDNIEMASLIVAETYKQHREKVKSLSVDGTQPDKIGAKLLVICKGEPSFSGFFNCQSMMEFKEKNPNVKLFGISSASGAYVDSIPESFLQGGEKYWGGIHFLAKGTSFKEKFMTALKMMKQNEDALIFNIDMLGEGIDISGITGVMPFIDMSIIKSSQTLGRAMRLCKEDRDKLYSGEIKSLEWSKMVKPRAWVVLPTYSREQKDASQRIINIAKRIWEDYNYFPIDTVKESANGDGRMESLFKDGVLSGDLPDDLTLLHMLQDKEFQDGADNFIQNRIEDIKRVRSTRENN